ncbi:MAG TPA: hypothetical protein VIB79_20330 [Candidatus Binatia bacterium]
MSTVYESLKGVVHETLQRNKTLPTPKFAASEPPSDISMQEQTNLADEIDDVEKFIGEKITRLKAAAKQTETLLTQESERSQETISGLREKIAALESQARDAEEKLQNRDHELRQTQANADALTRQVSVLESNLAKARDDAAAETRRASQLMETSTQKLSALEDRIKELDASVRDKEATIQGLEQKLATINQDFATQLQDKEKLMANRDGELNDIKSQLQMLTRWLQEMPSVLKQTESPALPVEPPDGSHTVERANGTERRPLHRESKAAPSPAKAAVAANQIVAHTFFDLMIRELTLIKGPAAGAAVREKVAGLGESIDRFPRSRLAELLEVLSKDIINDDLKIAFRKWFVKHA